MKTINKETHQCSCGHIHVVSSRKIPISKNMVRGMNLVYNYCKERSPEASEYRFTRKEVKHLFGNDETLTATFGNLVYFGGILFKYNRGNWGIHMDRARLFLQNNATVPEYVTKHPITGEITKSESRVLMKHVKGMREFLDSRGEYIVEYM